MKIFLTLLSTSFVLIGAFDSVYAAGLPAFPMMPGGAAQQKSPLGFQAGGLPAFGQQSVAPLPGVGRQAEMSGPGFAQQASFVPQSGISNTAAPAGGSFELFGKREAVAEQNALLRQTQTQIQMINSNPEAKLAYLRSMRQELGTKAEVARVRGLPTGQRANALEQLYARLRAENQGLMGRQQAMFGGASMPGLPGLPNFNIRQMSGQGKTVEASMNDIALHYQQQRRRATSPTLEVGPNDYVMSMRQNRSRSISGRAEVGPNDVRNFMQQSRY